MIQNLGQIVSELHATVPDHNDPISLECGIFPGASGREVRSVLTRHGVTAKQISEAVLERTSHKWDFFNCYISEAFASLDEGELA